MWCNCYCCDLDVQSFQQMCSTSLVIESKYARTLEYVGEASSQHNGHKSRLYSFLHRHKGRDQLYAMEVDVKGVVFVHTYIKSR